MFCSTIIPTVGRQTLDRAVNSVLDQVFTHDDFELIVVNDSGSPLPASAWQQSGRVTVLSTNRRERCVARNSGASIARGRYLHFLDDDDWLLPGALEAWWRLAQQNPQAAWLYGGSQLVDRQGNALVQLRPQLQRNAFVQTMAGAWLPLGSYLVDSRAFFSVGGFNPRITASEGIDLCRRITLHGEIAGTSEIIASIGVGEENSTTNYEPSVVQSQSRRARESILAESGVLSRLRSGARDDYWKGRIVRLYLSSAVWNLKQRQLPIAIVRLTYALFSALIFLPSVLSGHYWWAIRRPHDSFAFYQTRQ